MPDLQTSTIRRPDSATPSNPRREPNPLDVEIDNMLREFDEITVPSAQISLSGARRNLEHTIQQLAEASSYWPSGWFARASGYTGNLRQQQANDQQNVARRETFLNTVLQQSREMRDQYASVLEQQQLGETIEAETQRLHAQGGLTQEEFNRRVALAQEHFNAAQLGRARIIETMSSSRDESMRMNTQQIRSLQRINAQIASSAENLRRTEVVLRTTRNVLVVAGATIATGGVAAGGALTVGTVTTAVTVGTATGTGIGFLSNVAEAGSHIAHGNQDVSTASGNAAMQTLTDFRNSAVASVTAIPGIGAGRLIAPLGQTVNTATRVYSGMAAGGTSSTLASVTQSTISVATGEREFSLDTIVADALRDGTVGTLTGGIGARASVARQGAGFGSQIFTTGLEATSSIGVGLSVQELNSLLRNGRHMNFDEATQVITPSLVGSTVGGFAQNASPLRRPNPQISPEDFNALPIDERFRLLMEPNGLIDSLPDTCFWNRGGGAAFPGLAPRLNPPEPPALVGVGADIPTVPPASVFGTLSLPRPSASASGPRTQPNGAPVASSADVPPPGGPHGNGNSGSNNNAPNTPRSPAVNFGSIPPLDSATPNPNEPEAGNPDLPRAPSDSDAIPFLLPRGNPADLINLAFETGFNHPLSGVRAAAYGYVAKQLSRNPDLYNQFMPRLLRGLLDPNPDVRHSCAGALGRMDLARDEAIGAAFAVYAAYRIELSPQVRARMEMSLRNLTDLDTMSSIQQLLAGDRSQNRPPAQPRNATEEQAFDLISDGRGAESNLVRGAVSAFIEAAIARLVPNRSD